MTGFRAKPSVDSRFRDIFRPLRNTLRLDGRPVPELRLRASERLREGNFDADRAPIITEALRGVLEGSGAEGTSTRQTPERGEGVTTPEGASALRRIQRTLEKIESGEDVSGVRDPDQVRGEELRRMRGFGARFASAGGAASLRTLSAAQGEEAGSVGSTDFNQKIRELRNRATKFLRGTDSEKREKAKDIIVGINDLAERLELETAKDIREEIGFIEESLRELEGLPNDYSRRKRQKRDPYRLTLGSKGAKDLAAEPEIDLSSGGTVYHIHYGEVRIVSTEKDGLGTWVWLDTPSGRVKCLYTDQNIFHMDSRKARDGFDEAVSKRYHYLPHVVGLAFVSEFYTDYEKLIISSYEKGGIGPFKIMGQRVSRYLLRVGTKGGALVTRDYGNEPPEYRERQEALYKEDVEKGRKHLSAWGELTYIFERIYEETGDDVIDLGLQYFGQMRDVAKSLSRLLPRNSMYQNKTTFGDYIAHQMMLRDDVFRHFKGIRDEVNLRSQTEAEGEYLFWAGDYRADKRLYDKLRDGDSEAIDYWSGKIAPIIEGDARLKGADYLVPVIGREKWGRPVSDLAEAIGKRVDIPVLKDIWRPRPEKRLDSEAPQTFGHKVDQAFGSYRLQDKLIAERLGRGKRKSDHDTTLEGKVVIIIDDNYTTGATARAARRELMMAGAKKVYTVVATRTSIQKD